MKKVLIIEDEDKIRKIIKTFLEKKSFKIVEVADGKDAIDSFLTEKPDLVILDVMLPHKNGFEICKEIREFGNTPVLMLTAKTQDNDEINSFQLGADDFLRKPFSLEVLLVRVNKLLNISAKGVIQISNIIINEQSRNVEVAGNDIKLSPKDFRMKSLSRTGIPYTGKNITSKTLKNIVLKTEQLRARAISLRYKYLVDNFCDAARDAGYNPSVQIDQWISIADWKNNGLAVIPAIGVPTADRINDIYNAVSNSKFKKSEKWIIYDNRGILKQWLEHLDWLDNHLPIKAVNIMWFR